jgi:site-specific recombinase XerD
MSNKIYEDTLYNQAQKLRYLNNHNANTKSTYYRVLIRASSLEEEYGKDLYNFNIVEIEQLLSFLNPKTLSSCKIATSTIQRYIRWAIEQGLRTDNTNPLDAMVDKDFMNKFIDQSNELLYSKEDIDNITGSLINFIDAALVQSIFEGALGKGYSEILNLQFNDIDEANNQITLTNSIEDGQTTTRILKLRDDSNLITLLKKAFEQKTYYKNNGNPSPNNKSDEIKLVDNNYIFRSAALNIKHEDKAHPHIVLRKLKLMSEWFGYPYLTAINLRNSGMLYELYRLYMTYDEIEKEQYDILCDKYNVNKSKAGYYIVSRYKNEFLNLQTLKQIYDIE